MMYDYAIENGDRKRIDMLNCLINKGTFWDDVRCLIQITKQTSDKAVKRWQILSERRYLEIRAFDIACCDMENIGITDDDIRLEIDMTDSDDLRKYVKESEE